MILSTNAFFYLHGFASSPQSVKARYFADRFRAFGKELIIPDLNQNDFYHLTLSRQIRQVEALLPSEGSVTLIGSSFGGLTAAWLAERNPPVDRLILLAPAFQFLKHWIPKLGDEQMQRWRKEQSLLTYHYGTAQMMPIGYGFLTDLTGYEDEKLQRALPTLVLHGQQDDVIPIQASQTFAAQRSWVKLIELDSDHSLANVEEEIWQAVQAFLKAPN
jgi:pimeloyl-ACP methyl ester carboxylesterase